MQPVGRGTIFWTSMDSESEAKIRRTAALVAVLSLIVLVGMAIVTVALFFDITPYPLQY